MAVRTAPSASVGGSAAAAVRGTSPTASMRGAAAAVAAARSRVGPAGRGIRTCESPVRARGRGIAAIVRRCVPLWRVRATAARICAAIGRSACTSPRRAIICTGGHGRVVGRAAGTAETLRGLTVIGRVALRAPTARIVSIGGWRTIAREIILPRGRSRVPRMPSVQAAHIHSADWNVRSPCRRRGTRHDGAILDGARRAADVAFGVCSTECALSERRDTRVICYLRASQRCFIDMSSAAINSLAAGERAARGSGYGVSVVRIGVVKICIGVENVDVVDVGVVYVDPVNVTVAPVIPGVERFAKAQGEPADAEADSKPKAEASAEETDERRAIDREADSRAGIPAPPTANVTPAAIVKRSKAPGSIVDPSPAPRTNIAPIAVAVGSPVG